MIHPRHVWQDIGTVVTMAVNLSLSGDLDLDRCPMPCHLLQPFAVLSADTMWDELDDTNLPLLNYETGQFNKELQNINVSGTFICSCKCTEIVEILKITIQMQLHVIRSCL